MPANARRARFTALASGKRRQRRDRARRRSCRRRNAGRTGFGPARLKSYSGRISSSPTRGAGFVFFLPDLIVPFFIVNALLARDVAGCLPSPFEVPTPAARTAGG